MKVQRIMPHFRSGIVSTTFLCAACWLVVAAVPAWSQNSAVHPDTGSQFTERAQSKDLGSMDIESLMNIEVTTASRFADRLADAPSIMSVVTSNELRRFGGMTLNEILQRVPGLTVSTIYFIDRSQVVARGDGLKTADSHILFLINGRPTREVIDGGIISDFLESFPVSILERIEIIKGPGSVLYGSNAFSAVVNLITIKARSTQSTLTGLAGVDGALSATGNAFYKRGDLTGVAAVQLHELPDWPVVYTVPPSQRNLSFAPPVPDIQNISIVSRGVGGYLGLNYKGWSFMSTLTEWQGTGFVEGTVSWTRLAREFANLGYERQVNRRWNSSVNLTITRTTFTAPQFPDVVRDGNDSIVEWTNLISIASGTRLTAGALFDRLEGIEDFTVVSPPLRVAQGKRLGGAFYAQIDHQLVKQLKLVLGFQTNKIGTLPLNTVPRAGLIWSPSQRASVKALYSQAFRAPSLDENLLNHPGLGGNPNLKPEKVATFDLGLSFDGTRFQAGIDYFHSKLTDNIVNLPGPTRAVFFNLGGVTFNGVELEGKYYFRRDFFLQGSTLYQMNQDQNGLTNVTPVPTIGFKMGISYENAHGLIASLFDVSDGSITGPNYVGANPVQGWHHILTGNFKFDVSRYFPVGDRTGVAIVAHANNLTNQMIWLPSGYSSVDTVPVQQGRVVYAGLEFRLGKK